MGYKSIFIFECKNLQDKVDKNEILIFSNKINIANAQKGFFVAKSFTQGAVNQAKLDARLELVSYTEELSSDPFFLDFHYLANEVTNVNMQISTTQQHQTQSLDFYEAKVRIGGNLITGRDYLQTWIEDYLQSVQSKLPTMLYPTDVYSESFTDTRALPFGHMRIGSLDVSAIKIEVFYKMHIMRPIIYTTYDFSGRGRVIEHESVQLPQGEIKMRIARSETST